MRRVINSNWSSARAVGTTRHGGRADDEKAKEPTSSRQTLRRTIRGVTNLLLALRDDSREISGFSFHLPKVATKLVIQLARARDG